MCSILQKMLLDAWRLDFIHCVKMTDMYRVLGDRLGFRGQSLPEDVSRWKFRWIDLAHAFAPSEQNTACAACAGSASEIR